MTLIDSNILIDILGGDPHWSERSVRSLSACARRGPIAINDVVYAELAAGFASHAHLDDEIAAMRLKIAPMSKVALFLAGQPSALACAPMKKSARTFGRVPPPAR